MKKKGKMFINWTIWGNSTVSYMSNGGIDVLSNQLFIKTNVQATLSFLSYHNED